MINFFRKLFGLEPKNRKAHNRGKRLFRFEDGSCCFAKNEKEANKIHKKRVENTKNNSKL